MRRHTFPHILLCPSLNLNSYKLTVSTFVFFLDQWNINEIMPVLHLCAMYSWIKNRRLLPGNNCNGTWVSGWLKEGGCGAWWGLGGSVGPPSGRCAGSRRCIGGAASLPSSHLVCRAFQPPSYFPSRRSFHIYNWHPQCLFIWFFVLEWVTLRAVGRKCLSRNV